MPINAILKEGIHFLSFNANDMLPHRMNRALKNTALILFSCLVSMLYTLNTPAQAQDSSPVDVIISAADEAEGENNAHFDTTHTPVRLTPDKSELLRLDEKAGSVIIGNPNHVSVLAESADTLVLVPRVPGATHVTILDADKNVIMARHVIVASPKKKYVRIRRSCAGEENCQATQVYYCPDMCHEIVMGGGEDGATQASTLAAATGDVANAAAGQAPIDPEAVAE